jgi:ABC transport system ATP-binding/permease protein
MNSNFCPNCGSPNAPQARYCARCGQALVTRAPSPAPPAGQAASPPAQGAALPPQPPGSPAAPPTNCPQCHVPLRPNARFCPVCGYNLVSQPLPVPAQPAVAGQAPAPGGGAGTRLLSATPAIPTLVVHYMGGATQSHPLKPGRYQIGRAPGNDIVVNNMVVSGHHLTLDVQTDSLMVTDQNSTNGTMINGQRIQPAAPQAVHPGDILRIGDPTGNSVSMTFEGEAAESLRTLALGKLDLSNLTNIVIGRDPNSYLPLNHPTVSFRHAMILKQNGGLAIKDLGSTNGTFVNSQRISQVPLSSGDVIQIGPFKLVYDAQAQSLAQSIRLGHRLDAIQLGRVVAKGKKILDDVSVTVQSGEFVALVGGSGAGKSTLMKAMNGYEPANQGHMLLDGEALYPKIDLYRTQMGYVPQDDIIHRELPVRLALYYAAKLRLPDANAAEIAARIQDALKAVDMVEHADKPVRVLSGGQRKRVSIAVELLAHPSLFFLDEPTSGLDPGLEKKMMYDLNHLADEGRTVVLVTHATANIAQCDYVAFMSWGRLAYYGPPKDAISFFGIQDFADIYLRLSERYDQAKGQNPPPELLPYYQQRVAQAQQSGSPSTEVKAGTLWADHFKTSPLYQKFVTDRQRSLGAGVQSGSTPLARPKRARDSMIRQTVILARRMFDLIRHDLRMLVVLLFMMPFIGLMFMAVSKEDVLVGSQGRDAESIQANIQNRLEDESVGTTEKYAPYADAKILLVMIGLALTQGGTFGAAYEIVKERAIFKRERAVNLSVVGYVISKVIVLAIFGAIQVVSVVIILGLRVKMDYPPILFPTGWMELMVSLYLGVFCSIAFGLLISAAVPSTDLVLYIILAQLFVQIILSGTLFPLPANPISKLTPGYWTMDALASSVDLPELDKIGISCKVVDLPPKELVPNPTIDDKVKCASAAAEEESIKNYDHTNEHLIQDWVAMLILSAVFLTATTIVQARKKIE